jgi:hypothetical protein
MCNAAGPVPDPEVHGVRDRDGGFLHDQRDAGKRTLICVLRSFVDIRTTDRQNVDVQIVDTKM